MTCKILIAGETPSRFTALERRNGGSNGVDFEHIAGADDLEERLASEKGQPIMVVAGRGTDVRKLRRLRDAYPDIPFVFEQDPERGEDLGTLIDRYDQMRTDFLSRLSHEVRSPLGVVVGVLGELEATLPMDDDTRQLLALADRGVRRLRGLSESLMEVAELEALGDSALQVERSPVDVRDIVRAAVDRVRAAESRSNVHLEVTLPDEPVKAHVDARRIERVVAILVSNAMRFSSKRAEIAVDTTGGDIRIVAEDDGAGIAPDVRRDVFGRFVGRHLEGRKSGVAFGLSIAHDYVKAHGGTIEIEDARPDALEGEPRGTRVTVLMPRQKV